MSKYRNKKIKIDGYTFDSLKEGRRYEELKLLRDQGKIKELKVHPRYPLLSMNGDHICTYVGDFEYEVDGPSTKNGIKWIKVTEDVKSPITRKCAVYRIKKKWFKADYGREIREV